MRLHAYRHQDGAFEVVYDGASASAPMPGARDLGEAEMDLSAFSTALVLTIGLSARAVARGRDAVVVEHALALRDTLEVPAQS